MLRIETLLHFILKAVDFENILLFIAFINLKANGFH